MMLAFGLVVAGHAAGKNPFVGTWVSDTTKVTLILNEDLTGTYLKKKITYTYEDNTVDIVIGKVHAPGATASGKLFWGSDSWTKQ